MDSVLGNSLAMGYIIKFEDKDFLEKKLQLQSIASGKLTQDPHSKFLSHNQYMSADRLVHQLSDRVGMAQERSSCMDKHNWNERTTDEV